MTETVTITHHVQKPEYHWEIVIPEGPTVLLAAEKIDSALDLLGVMGEDPRREQILALGNGESQGVDAELTKGNRLELASLGKQKTDVGVRVRRSMTA
ncbi:MAG: hypothetical protein ACRYFU_15045 [Janthinobacterium lividum]